MSTNFVTGDQLQEIITAINTKYNERFARKEDIAASYKDKGSKAAAELTSALLVEANEGYGYNLADELVITKDNKDLFVESAALRAAEYALTSDTVAVAGKTYYKSDGLLPPTYKEVTKVVVGTTDVSAYYEKTAAATYKFDAMPGIFPCKVVTEAEVQDIIDSIDD